MSLVYLGVNTTGDSPRLHDAWEIAILLQGHPSMADGTYQWQLNPDLQAAVPEMLKVTGFSQRNVFTAAKGATVGSGYTVEHTDYKPGPTNPEVIAQEIAAALQGSTVVAINPARVMPFVDAFLRSYGHLPMSHPHTVDALSLAAGYMLGRISHSGHGLRMATAMDAVWVCELLGVPAPGPECAALALEHARWAGRLYQRAMGANA